MASGREPAATHVVSVPLEPAVADFTVASPGLLDGAVGRGQGEQSDAESTAGADASTGSPPPAPASTPSQPGGAGQQPTPAVDVDVDGVTVDNPKVTVPLTPATTTITATATPANATNVTFSLTPGSVAPHTGTTIDATTGVVTVDADQAGGTIRVRAESANAAGSAWADFPLQLVEVPTGIASTTSSPDADDYGGQFTHTLSAPSQSSALEGGAINEHFDSLTATQPWGGEFTLTANAANSPGWALDSSGEMAGPDNVTIKDEADGLDARRLIANASNPTPTNTPPAQFAMTQHLRPKDFPGGTWSGTDFTTVDHIRGVREVSGDLEVFVGVNTEEEATAYNGRPTYRNLSGASTVQASAPAPEGGTEPDRNTVTFTAEALPNTANMVFSLVGNQAARKGCTIDASSGVLTVGLQAGTVKVRVSNGSQNPTFFDEIDLTITAIPEAPEGGDEEGESPDGGANDPEADPEPGDSDAAAPDEDAAEEPPAEEAAPEEATSQEAARPSV